MTKSGEEDIKNKKPFGLYGIIALLLCSLIYAGIMKYKTYVEFQEISGDTTKTINGLMIENQKLKEEVKDMKSKIENIKNTDDLLERDIKLYIKSHYRKVPRSVAAEIASLTIKFGKQYYISPILIIGMMQVESGFNPMITGPKTKYGNARGLMQVMPEWVKKFELKDVYDLYDIDTNIESGCKVFNIHKEEVKGSIPKALFKYVNGSTRYVEDVYKAMGKFVTFRSTLDNGNNDDPVEEPEEKEEKTSKDVDKPAESSN